jgi:hypothetical protein
MQNILRYSGTFAAPKSALADFGKYVADLGKPEIGGVPE